MYSHSNKASEQINQINMNKFTLRGGLAGLLWESSNKEFDKSDQGNSKSQ
jgi:hypothetical protein